MHSNDKVVRSAQVSTHHESDRNRSTLTTVLKLSLNDSYQFIKVKNRTYRYVSKRSRFYYFGLKRTPITFFTKESAEHYEDTTETEILHEAQKE
jgi:hypothetical protein